MTARYTSDERLAVTDLANAEQSHKWGVNSILLPPMSAQENSKAEGRTS